MEARQLAQGDPQLTLPLQQIDLLVVPGHQAAEWLMIGPVSYTHLDVYKRQL